MKQGRRPQIGDMLIVTPERRVGASLSREKGHIGIVRKIVLDKWQHQKNVFVVWQGDKAPNYNTEHGYCGVNIHNLRSEFRVFRNGEEIK